MADNFNVVVAGHICLDVIPNLNHIPEGKFGDLFQPGRLISVGPALFSTGGPVSNTGLALVRLGVQTQLAGKVGNDPFGGIVRSLVEKFAPGLGQALIIDPSAPTSYTVIISPPGVDRVFLHCTGANDQFYAHDIDENLLRQATLFHFGYPPLMRSMYERNGAELVEVFRRAKSTGVTTSLDMAFPDPSSDAGKANWPLILEAVLPFIDIFVPSFEEILFMLRRDTYVSMIRTAPDGNIINHLSPQLLNDLSSQMIEMGAAIVMIKLGNRGAYLRTAGEDRFAKIGRAKPVDVPAWVNQEMWAPCFKVNVVGTTGSGDATIAGFLGALLRGYPPDRAITAAVAVGACNVEAADALGGIRTWDETMLRIEDGWQRYSFTIDAPGWFFDPAVLLWRNHD